MDELIKELEENQEINYKNDLENRVDIPYIINRLKDINILKEFVKGELLFNIESLINENYMESENQKDVEKIQNLTDSDIEKLTNIIYDTDWLWDVINENMDEAITSELQKYLNK